MGAGQVVDPNKRRMQGSNSSIKDTSTTPKRRNRNKMSRSPKKKYNALLPPQLKEHEGRITVVLDMDETMIHSQFETKNTYRQHEDRANATREPDFKFQLKLDNSIPPETVKVFKRPYLDEFLKALSEEFEVVVFTAAVPLYASPVLDRSDKNGYVLHRLYRSSTITYKGQPYVKDISKLGRDMAKILLIDNNPCAMLANPDNVIPIMSYTDSPTDRELPKVLALLRKLKKMDDIRPFLIKRFRFRENMMQLLH